MPNYYEESVSNILTLYIFQIYRAMFYTQVPCYIAQHCTALLHWITLHYTATLKYTSMLHYTATLNYTSMLHYIATLNSTATCNYTATLIGMECIVKYQTWVVYEHCSSVWVQDALYLRKWKHFAPTGNTLTILLGNKLNLDLWPWPCSKSRSSLWSKCDLNLSGYLFVHLWHMCTHCISRLRSKFKI